jgi:ATP synthase protein I
MIRFLDTLPAQNYGARGFGASSGFAVVRVCAGACSRFRASSMTAPADRDGRGELSPEERAAFKRRVSELEGKLGRAEEQRAAKAPKPVDPDRPQAASGVALGQAMRIGIELVVGVAVGGLIGWALDRYLGTAPVLMIVLFIAGFAAGLLNVIRTAQRMQPKVLPGKDLADDDGDDR